MNASSCHAVFIYGTLMADEVVRVLLKRVPKSCPATLLHFHRFSIKERVYPAIIHSENDAVVGKVLLDISDRELEMLDAFEDVEYQKRIVEVILQDTSQRFNAYAYVWTNEKDSNLFGSWDFEEWKQQYMEDFVKMTEGFVNGLDRAADYIDPSCSLTVVVSSM